MKGYVPIHRQLAYHDLWLAEKFTRGQAWVDMLMLANHKDGEIRVRGMSVAIKRGQLGWSELALASRWKWSRGKLRRFFNELRLRKMCTTEQNNKTTITTILNYEAYAIDNEKCGTAERTPNGTPNGHQTDTNDNGENGENKIQGTLTGTCPRQADGPSNCPHQKIVDLWNETLPELPQVKIVSEARKKSIRARWREDKQRQNVDWWKGFFEYIRTCSFLMGASNNNDRPFELTFDWMLKPRNFVKIVEGNYVDR